MKNPLNENQANVVDIQIRGTNTLAVGVQGYGLNSSFNPNGSQHIPSTSQNTQRHILTPGTSTDVKRRWRKQDENLVIPAHLICNGSSIKKEYPPTTLPKPVLLPYTHLRKSIVNETIQKLNELVYVLFKQKIKLEEGILSNLFRYFKIQIPKVNGTSLD